MNYYVLLFIIVIILIFLCWNFNENMTCNCGKNKDSDEYVSLDATLDNEHKLIIGNLNELIKMANDHWNDSNRNEILNKQINSCYDVAKQHWDTENKYFEIGKKNMPASHKNMDNEINNHIAEHNDGLDKITNLKPLLQNSKEQFIGNVKKIKLKILNHINDSDLKHFGHWINNKALNFSQ